MISLPDVYDAFDGNLKVSFNGSSYLEVAVKISMEVVCSSFRNLWYSLNLLSLVVIRLFSMLKLVS